MNAIDRARIEWEVDGVVSTSTVCELNNLGIDAEALIESFNKETNG